MKRQKKEGISTEKGTPEKSGALTTEAWGGVNSIDLTKDTIYSPSSQAPHARGTGSRKKLPDDKYPVTPGELDGRQHAKQKEQSE